MNRTVLALAAAVALTAACSREPAETPVDAVPADAGEATTPETTSNADAILASAAETGVDSVVLIVDRSTGCQYFAASVGGTTGGLTDLQPRYNDPTTPRCVNADNLPPRPLFVPTEPFGGGDTGVGSIRILLDRETKCQYFLTTVGGRTGGVTSIRPRLNANGTVRCEP